MRPIEWLLTQANIDERWCIVHATHMTEREVAGLAKSGAVAGLAPTTEADLGDGTFPAETFIAGRRPHRRRQGSNTIIDPFAELRQLEWSQRIRGIAGATSSRRRPRHPSAPRCGQCCAHDGARAMGRKTGALAPGLRADLVVLDASDPALAEKGADDLLDAAIFGPARHPVRDVMSGGAWIVLDGRHAREDEIFARYRATLRTLAA
jgi:formimidoylglutamate deiminase